jgi:hypothetical protein
MLIFWLCKIFIRKYGPMKNAVALVMLLYTTCNYKFGFGRCCLKFAQEKLQGNRRNWFITVNEVDSFCV